MNRRPTSHSTPTGRAHKAVTALLLATMLLVPLAPFGGATDPTGFDVKTVSGSQARSTTAAYNFTFTVADDDVTSVKLDLPSGFTMGSVSSTNTGMTGTPSGRSVNLTGSALSPGDYYVHTTGNDVPGYADTFSGAKITLHNGTANNGTATDSIAVTAQTLDADLDSDHDDDMILGSGATTSLYIEVDNTFTSNGLKASDSVNFTFPDAFDITGAKIGSEVDDGQSIGYDADGSEADTFTITITGVENPTVTESKSYTIEAEVLDSAGKTVADDTFTITIVPTGIDTRDTGASTEITEGETEDDSITVALETEPSDDVTITIDTGDELDADKTALIFTSANWDTKQTVKLTAVDDTVVEGTTEETITLTSSSDDANYDDLEDLFDVTILDNDVGLVLRHLDEDGDEDDETVVTEGASTGDTYEVVLSTKPDDTVTVTIEPHSNLEVDDTELTFSTSDSGSNSWNLPQEIEVTSLRTDDNDFLDDVEYTIVHTTESDDSDYEGLEEELTVILRDDEHPALGLTDEQIRDANKLVELEELTETDDGIMLKWTLPDQEDLDEIFDFDNPTKITVEGVQVLYSNSPYTIAATFDDGDDAFDDAEYVHDFDDDASSRTKYLVTMFFDEDAGKWDADNVPDTRDDGYEGTALQEPLLPWWGWILIAAGAVILLIIILAAVMSSQNRKAYGDVGWDDEDDEAAAAAADDEPASKKKDKARKYDLECPVCDHHFTAKGTKPLKTECPSCGAKGVLN